MEFVGYLIILLYNINNNFVADKLINELSNGCYIIFLYRQYIYL